MRMSHSSSLAELDQYSETSSGIHETWSLTIKAVAFRQTEEFLGHVDPAYSVAVYAGACQVIWVPVYLGLRCLVEIVAGMFLLSCWPSLDLLPALMTFWLLMGI